VRLRTTAIHIDHADPFREDCLDRKIVVESLMAIVKRVTPPLVLCIDSPWGTGKTTFLKLWEAQSKLEAVEALYFNAWSTDFATDPLIPFVAEIAELVSAKAPNKATKYVSRTKLMASALARRALPAAGKLLTAGLLDLEQVSEEVLAELAEDSIADVIDSYTTEKSLIAKFQEQIAKLVAQLPPSEAGARLLLLVDELDRCRPDYALALLERIKHLFNVDNIIFVLALDKRQLKSSIEAIYGSSIDSEDYLRRFIDLEYRLPDPKPDAYAKYLYRKFEFDGWFKARTQGVFRYDAENLVRTFCDLSRVFDLSLRVQEQCFSRIRLAMLATKENFYFFPNLIAALVILRTVCPSAYRAFSLPRGSAAELLDAIRSLPSGQEYLSEHSGTVLEYFLLSVVRGRETDPAMDEIQRLADDVSAEGPAKQRASKIVEIRRNMQMHDRNPSLDYLLSKIEIGFQFA
jgi:hypothetical protein